MLSKALGSRNSRMPDKVREGRSLGRQGVSRRKAQPLG